MKILSLTTLYPNNVTPHHGVFVENRLRAFAKKANAEIRVVAPVPWFPFKQDIFGKYAKFGNVKSAEIRNNISVSHPRYFIPPKIGMTYAAESLTKCFRKACQHALDEGFDFDLIDAHYLYPDGVAAVAVAREFGKPVYLTARGSDVSLIPKYPLQRRMILDAIEKSTGVICVASALKDELIRLGAQSEKIHVLRNGVDLDLFTPKDQITVRNALHLAQGPVIASVGHLIERKGHDLAIEAMTQIPDATLLIAGDGELQATLEEKAQSLGVQNRVKFLGTVAHSSLPDVYSAADCLVLASSREGWPNVLLEAMACGTPAVAAPIWGCGEVITTKAAGQIAAERTSQAITQSIKSVLGDPPSRTETRKYAEQYSCDETSEKLNDLFSSTINREKLKKQIRYRHLNIAASRDKPKLIVTVDTEERFDWADFSNDQTSVCPIEDIHPFQDLCERFKIAPIYFLTHPLIENPKTAAYFKSLTDQKKAEAALHFHQWVSPPLSNYHGEFHSFQKNIPLGLHCEKMDTLAAMFEQILGFRARAHRAGRYGISQENYPSLKKAGIHFDFSPSPGFDQSQVGGPDFEQMSNQPFAIDHDKDQILVTPVSGARALIKTNFFMKQNASAPGYDFPRSKRSPQYAPMRLTSEGTNIAMLEALTKHLISEGTPVLTFSVHSTTFTAGANQYGDTAESVEKILILTERYFDFFTRKLGGSVLGIDQLATLYASEK